MGFRVWGLGYGVEGLGFRAWGLGLFFESAPGDNPKGKGSGALFIQCFRSRAHVQESRRWVYDLCRGAVQESRGTSLEAVTHRYAPFPESTERWHNWICVKLSGRIQGIVHEDIRCLGCVGSIEQA